MITNNYLGAKKQRFKAFFFSITCLMLVGQLEAQTLRSVAPSGKYIGTIMKSSFSQTNDANKPVNQLSPGSDIYNQVNISSTHFNAFEMENGMKMNNVLKNYDSSKFPNIATSDLNLVEVKRFVKFCNDHNMRSRGHALMWYSQAPSWLVNKKPSKSEIYTFMEQYIKAFMGAFGVKGEIDEWDVANEMLLTSYNQYGFRTTADGSNDAVWYSNIAGQGQAGSAAYNTEIDNLLVNCFKWAKQADPDAKLFYNDYSIEDVFWNKSIAAYDLISRLRSKGAPIDGIGFQSHFISSNFINGGNITPNLVANIRKFAGLKNASNQSILVSITELDIRNEGGNMTPRQIQDSYWNVVSKSLAEPNCNLVLIWGISEKDSWIPGAFNKTPYLLWDRNYNQNGTPATDGAWRGVYDGLRALPDTSVRNFVVRAKGTNGREQIQLLLNNTVVKTWTLSTSYQDLNFSGGDGTVRVQYVNDGIGGDAQIDYVKVNNTIFQAENQSLNTAFYANGRCGGGSNSEFMHCNGFIEFAGSQNARLNSNRIDEILVNEEESIFHIYPNPSSSGTVVFDLPEATQGISVLDCSGRIVKEIKVNKEEHSKEVSLDLPSGTYWIQLQNTNVNQVKKLVIQ